MKLLLDQNLSFRLVPALAETFPGSKHVKDFDLTKADDDIIWRLAKEQDFVIVSKDSDFLHRSLVHGFPPKVIQLHIGNCSAEYVRGLLARKTHVIKDFLNDPNEALLVIE